MFTSSVEVFEEDNVAVLLRLPFETVKLWEADRTAAVGVFEKDTVGCDLVMSTEMLSSFGIDGEAVIRNDGDTETLPIDPVALTE